MKTLELLRELNACDSAVGGDFSEDGPGWVYRELRNNPGTTWAELWRMAALKERSHAWWLAGRLGVGQDELREAVHRALRNALNQLREAGLSYGHILGREAESSALYLPAVVKAAAEFHQAHKWLLGARVAVRAVVHTGAAADLLLSSEKSKMSFNAGYMFTAVAQEAVWASVGAGKEMEEHNAQEKALLCLWPEIEKRLNERLNSEGAL